KESGKRGEKTMYCIYSGARYHEQAAICAKCGKPVHTTDLRDPVSLTSSSASVGEAAVTRLHSASWHRDIGVSAKWIRRVGIPLATLAWIGLVAVVLWAASHVARSLILLAIAAILAYALAPLVKVLQRFMPRL